MESAKCRRCGQFWAFTANPILFEVVTRLCPMCLPVELPQMDAVGSAKCRKCGQAWAFTASPALSDVITHLCPDCVAKALPLMGGLPVLRKS